MLQFDSNYFDAGHVAITLMHNNGNFGTCMVEWRVCFLDVFSLQFDLNLYFQICTFWYYYWMYFILVCNLMFSYWYYTLASVISPSVLSHRLLYPFQYITGFDIKIIHQRIQNTCLHASHCHHSSYYHYCNVNFVLFHNGTCYTKSL